MPRKRRPIPMSRLNPVNLTTIAECCQSYQIATCASILWYSFAGWSLLNKKRIWRSSFSEHTLSSPSKMRGAAKATLYVRGNLSSSCWWSLKWMTRCRRPRSARLGHQPKSYLPAETSLNSECTTFQDQFRKQIVQAALQSNLLEGTVTPA